MERRYGNSVTVGDGCDGIFDSGGGSEITVTTVTYRHGEDMGYDEKCANITGIIYAAAPLSLDGR